MQPRPLLWTVAALCLACSADPTPATGSEQGPCYPNRTCDEGLVCASDLCVDLEGGDTDASGNEDGAEGGGAHGGQDEGQDGGQDEGQDGGQDGADGDPDDGDRPSDGEGGDGGQDCLDNLFACYDEPDRLQPCMGDYIDCRASQGVSECAAVDESCQHLGTEPQCEDTWPWCYGGDAGDGGDGGDDGGNADCLTQSQCQQACSNRAWICANCDVPAYCPGELDLETCLWECDVAFDTDNDIVFELNTCALQLGQTCNEDALIDCFYSTHC